MKECCTCKRILPVTSFNKRAKSHDGLQSRCRDCVSQWYVSHKEQHKANTARNKRALRPRRLEWLRTLLDRCVDCGVTDIRVLEFDHVTDDKEFDVCTAMQSGFSRDRILAEISKCEVVCSNCHRIRTNERVASWRSLIWKSENGL